MTQATPQRRIAIALRRCHLASRIAHRLEDKSDNQYVAFLLNKALRYRQLAESIAINELHPKYELFGIRNHTDSLSIPGLS